MLFFSMLNCASPAIVARLLVHLAEGDQAQRLALDLDGDGVLTSADLLLHTLQAAGKWTGRADRPPLPVVLSHVVRPGGLIRLVRPANSDAAVIFGMSHATWRLPPANEREDEWQFNLPDTVPAKDAPKFGQLWFLHERVLSRSALLTVQRGPTLRAAVLGDGAEPRRLRIEVENLLGTPDKIAVTIGKRSWNARRQSTNKFRADDVEVTAGPVSVRVSDSGGTSNSVPLHRRPTLVPVRFG
jgi:hypothetical protein